MYENQIQNSIIKSFEKAKETESITSGKVYEIFRDTIYDIVTEGTAKVDGLASIVKDAVITAVELFQDDKEKKEENITSAVKGIMAGIKLCKDNSIGIIKQKIKNLEAEIKLEEKELSHFFKQGIKGINEAESALPEKIKTMIVLIVSDIESNYTELSDIDEQSIKEAVKKAIESGGNIKETVIQITKNATKKALKQSRLKVDKIKEITEKILSDAVDTAEETGKNIKDVTSGAFKGIQEGMASMADSVTDTTKEFIREDLCETKEDLKTIKDLFLETVLKVARRSGKAARKVLNDLASQSKTTGSTLKEETGSAADKLSEKLKTLGKEAVKAFGETGGKVTHIMSDEAKELGKKSINVAKGSIKGMWKGAKEALKKDKNK